MAWIFDPTSVTHNGTDYGTNTHTALDEWPPSAAGAGERLQTPNTTNGSSRIVTIGFDCSTASAFAFGMSMVLVHATTVAAGTGWSVSAQLRVNGVNVGDPVVETTSTTSTSHLYSLFRWPNSVLATVDDNPSLVDVRLTSTNNTGSTAQHHLSAAKMFISPFSSITLPTGVSSSNVVAAWDAKVTQSTLSLWTDGGAVTMVPDLVGGTTMLPTTGTAVFEDDLSPVALIDPTDMRWVTQLASSLSDAWIVHITRTADVAPTGDSNSTGLFTGNTSFHNFADTTYNTILPSWSGSSDGGVSWILMCGPVGAEDDHIRGLAANGPTTSTPYVLLGRLNSSGNEKLWSCFSGDDFASDSLLVLDGQSASGTNQMRSPNWGSRGDGSRFWGGYHAALYILNGALSESTAMEYAQSIAVYHGIMTSGAATVTPSVIAVPVTLPTSSVSTVAAGTVVAVTLTLPTATAVGAAVVTPSVISVPLTVPTPGFSTGGTNATASPPVIAIGVTLPTAAVNVELTVSVINVVVELPITAALATPAAPRWQESGLAVASGRQEGSL